MAARPSPRHPSGCRHIELRRWTKLAGLADTQEEDGGDSNTDVVAGLFHPKWHWQTGSSGESTGLVETGLEQALELELEKEP